MESVSEVRVSVESAPALVILPLNQNRDRRLRILDLKDEQEAEVNIIDNDIYPLIQLN